MSGEDDVDWERSNFFCTELSEKFGVECGGCQILDKTFTFHETLDIFNFWTSLEYMHMFSTLVALETRHSTQPNPPRVERDAIHNLNIVEVNHAVEAPQYI